MCGENVFVSSTKYHKKCLYIIAMKVLQEANVLISNQQQLLSLCCVSSCMCSFKYSTEPPGLSLVLITFLRTAKM